MSILEILNANLPENLQKPHITTIGALLLEDLCKFLETVVATRFQKNFTMRSLGWTTGLLGLFDGTPSESDCESAGCMWGWAAVHFRTIIQRNGHIDWRVLDRGFDGFVEASAFLFGISQEAAGRLFDGERPDHIPYLVATVRRFIKDGTLPDPGLDDAVNTSLTTIHVNESIIENIITSIR